MAKVILSSPAEIEGDWEYCWFDPTHQHFLLIKDSYLYLLHCESIAQGPTLFAHIRDLPRSLLCGRISIDRKLVAMQTSLSSVTVFDVSSKKKYVADIRYPNENGILTSGIMWSDHGGNSEDLIIVTAKGMELYKVSQLRGQCKISRVISQPVSSFWYNPEHRMVMLAAHAQSKFGYNRNPQSAFFSPEDRPKEMLLIDGFFLNCEKANMPMLELPPPDRVPRLELGPGLGTEDVSLVSLYGKILCLVRYVEHGMDFITVFQMTKAKAERIHCLALNLPTHGLLYSTYDNLLICHCMGERVSVVFDIQSSPARSSDGASALDKTHPLGSAAAMHFLHKHKGLAAVNSVSSARNSTAVSHDRTQSQSHDGRRPSTNQPLTFRASSTSIVSDGEVRSRSRDAMDWAPVVTPQKRNSRLGQQMMFGKKEADISNFDTLVFSGELTDRYAEVMNADSTPQYAVLSNPEPAQEVYSTYAFEYLAPGRLLDSHRRVVWEVKCSFPGIVRDMTKTSSDPREIPLFLSRRGQRYSRQKQAAEGLQEYGVITMEGRLAKQLMLSELYRMLHHRADGAALKAYYRGLMRSYGCEYRRLVLAQYEAMHTQDTGSVTPATPPGHTSAGTSTGAGSTSFFSMTAAARRRAVAEGLFGSSPRRQTSVASPPPSHGGNMGVYPGLLNLLPGSPSPAPSSNSNSQAAEGAEGGSALESDPLELSGTMQLMLPDISMVGVRARKQQYLANQQPPAPVPLPPSATASPSAPKIKPTCQVVALHTRRDLFGCLICTQAEILSHVWLPVLLNSDLDYEYCALALTLFVTHLRESGVSVAPVFSALLLNLLFHSHRYVEVSRMLQERQLPDSLDLALYSLEFCDMLHDHIESLSDNVYRQSLGALDPSAHISPPSSAEKPLRGLTLHGAARSSVDDLQRHQSALANMRQAALDVLTRLDERTTLVKWHLSHGHILEAIAVCKRRNGQWQPPLTPGSIPASEFFASAVAAVTALLKPIDAEVLRLAESDTRKDDGEGGGGSGASPKEVRRLQDRRDAAMATAVQVFHTLYLFLKEWDGVVLLSSTNTGKSRLASQVTFPEHLFEGRPAEQFRRLFGFL